MVANPQPFATPLLIPRGPTLKAPKRKCQPEKSTRWAKLSQPFRPHTVRQKIKYRNLWKSAKEEKMRERMMKEDTNPRKPQVPAKLRVSYTKTRRHWEVDGSGGNPNLPTVDITSLHSNNHTSKRKSRHSSTIHQSLPSILSHPKSHLISSPSPTPPYAHHNSTSDPNAHRALHLHCFLGCLVVPWDVRTADLLWAGVAYYEVWFGGGSSRHSLRGWTSPWEVGGWTLLYVLLF
jgi:hypothetical protein